MTTVKYGTITNDFLFRMTNVSSSEVTINGVRTSCGCTVPKLPPLPWKLATGTNGEFRITMNLAGKMGTVIKTVTVDTDKGYKALFVRAVIEPPPAGAIGQADRMRNMQIAMANRQAVFRGDCASCHATPAHGKMGQELFAAACGVCHDAEHRASMVPDLRKLEKETNAEYWRTWITDGKAGSLMPAFALERGGILSKEQIDSLVDHLVQRTPSQIAEGPRPSSH